MSTTYKTSKDVPTDVLIARAEQLIDFITKGPEAVARNFTMRVPAELDHDADLVLSEIVNRLKAFITATFVTDFKHLIITQANEVTQHCSPDGWKIEYNPKPIADINNDYDFVHEDYDGADGGNGLCGTASSFKDAINQITQIEIKLSQQCCSDPIYICHKCRAVTPPPAPFKFYVDCSCGVTTAATAALVSSDEYHYQRGWKNGFDAGGEAEIVKHADTHEKMKSVIEAVANIGIDFGFGEYTIQPDTIELARGLCKLPSEAEYDPPYEPLPPVKDVVDLEGFKLAIIESLADVLGDAYDCGRTWSAWGVGTMSQNDFYLVRESPDRMSELADAVINSIPPYLREENRKLTAEVARLEPLQYRAAPCHKLCEAQAFNIEIRQLKARIAELESVPAIAALIDIAGTTNKTATDKQFSEHLQRIAKQALSGQYEKLKSEYDYGDWQLVPKLLTDEMSNAVHDVMLDHEKNGDNDSYPNFYVLWDQLLASAPEHQYHTLDAIVFYQNEVNHLLKQLHEAHCPSEVKLALERISRWHGEFPPANDREGNPSTFGALYGSNGERDYMRHIAKTALDFMGGECDHEWVDATNSRISGTDVCPKCFAVRPQNIQVPKPPPSADISGS